MYWLTVLSLNTVLVVFRYTCVAVLGKTRKSHRVFTRRLATISYHRRVPFAETNNYDKFKITLKIYVEMPVAVFVAES